MDISINVDILEEKDLVEKYNRDAVSKNLINYLVNGAMTLDDVENLQIIVNKSSKIKKDVKNLLIEGLKNEVALSIIATRKNNILQVLLLGLGIIFLFLATQIINPVWHEILIIGGWVPIWEVIHLELFYESKERKRRYILNKLINSEIVENDLK